MVNNFALIITASINPQNIPYLTLVDKTIRLHQYLDALEKWINNSLAKNIIFCENTGESLASFEAIKELALKKGKDLEVIIYDSNEGASKYGKGYGEGEIMYHTLENSRIIKHVQSFYK